MPRERPSEAPNGKALIAGALTTHGSAPGRPARRRRHVEGGDRGGGAGAAARRSASVRSSLPLSSLPGGPRRSMATHSPCIVVSAGPRRGSGAPSAAASPGPAARSGVPRGRMGRSGPRLRARGGRRGVTLRSSARRRRPQERAGPPRARSRSPRRAAPPAVLAAASPGGETIGNAGAAAPESPRNNFLSR